MATLDDTCGNLIMLYQTHSEDGTDYDRHVAGLAHRNVLLLNETHTLSTSVSEC